MVVWELNGDHANRSVHVDGRPYIETHKRCHHHEEQWAPEEKVINGETSLMDGALNPTRYHPLAQASEERCAWVLCRVQQKTLLHPGSWYDMCIIIYYCFYFYLYWRG